MKTNKPLIPFPLGEVKHTNGPKILYQISPALLCTQCEREVKTHKICFSHHFLQISLVILYLTLICGLRALDFPGGTSSKEPACQWRRHKRQGFNPWVGKILWRRAWQSTPVFLPGKSHGQRSLASYNPWGRKDHVCDWACTHTYIYIAEILVAYIL